MKGYHLHGIFTFSHELFHNTIACWIIRPDNDVFPVGLNTLSVRKHQAGIG